MHFIPLGPPWQGQAGCGSGFCVGIGLLPHAGNVQTGEILHKGNKNVQ